jgi:hypothetical protein
VYIFCSLFNQILFGRSNRAGLDGRVCDTLTYVIEEKHIRSCWLGKPEGNMQFAKPRHRWSCIFKSIYARATVIICSLSKINEHLPGICVIIHMILLIISLTGTFTYLDGNSSIFTYRKLWKHFQFLCPLNYAFLVAQEPNSSLGNLIIEASRISQTLRHIPPVALLGTSDQLVAYAAT